MPELLIHCAGGGWQATFANTNTALEFAGGTGTAEQVANVELFGKVMTGDADATMILDIFTGGPVAAAGDEAAVAATLIQDIFGAVDALSYEGDMIFEAAVGETLLDGLEAAGAALLAAL